MTGSQSDVISTHWHLEHAVDVPGHVALLRFCIYRIKIWDIKFGYCEAVHYITTKQLKGGVQTMHWGAALLKLKLVPVIDFMKNITCAGDSKFIEVYLCQKVSVLEWSLIEILQK